MSSRRSVIATAPATSVRPTTAAPTRVRRDAGGGTVAMAGSFRLEHFLGLDAKLLANGHNCPYVQLAPYWARLREWPRGPSCAAT